MASQAVRPRPRGQAFCRELPARTRAHRLANLTSLGFSRPGLDPQYCRLKPIRADLRRKLFEIS
jgi:hypothetical protein